MSRRLVACLVGLAGLVANLCSAQDVLTDLYGQAVHAYYAGHPQQASDLLNTAIDAGSRDPRAYYYRGLSNTRLGYSFEAASDFATAAAIEAADADQFYNVNRALERIQGNQRLAIEKHRIQARVNALRRSEEMRRQRYEQIHRAEPNVTVPVQPDEDLPSDTLPERESETEMPVEEAPAEEPADMDAEPATEEAPAEEPAEEMAPEEPAAEPMEEPAAEEPAVEEPAAEPIAPEEAPAAEPEPPAEAPDEALPEIEIPAPTDTPAAPEAPATP